MDLGVRTATVIGHSYGAWLALNLALDEPSRVDRLVLLDPTGCLSGMRPSYRAHAVPLFARPSAAAMQRFLRWETDGAALDAAWLRLTCLGHEAKGSPLVLPRRPAVARMQAMTTPTTVLLAERSRQLSVHRATRVAARLLPTATVQVVPGATHHTLPTLHAEQVDATILAPSP